MASPLFRRPATRSSRFRAERGTVILITNAPRPAASVQRILDRLDVPRDAYDAIVSSGDVTRGIVEARLRATRFSSRSAARLCRSLPVSTSPSRRPRPPTTSCARACSTTPSRRRRIIASCWRRCARARLFMVCANPDIVVERGDELVYCAGALADAYAALGGEVLYCGKPHAPIYEAALGKAARTSRRRNAAAQAGAGDRRFGPDRPERRGVVRRRLPVRCFRHACRGRGRTRSAGPIAA